MGPLSCPVNSWPDASIADDDLREDSAGDGGTSLFGDGVVGSDAGSGSGSGSGCSGCGCSREACERATTDWTSLIHSPSSRCPSPSRSASCSIAVALSADTSTPMSPSASCSPAALFSLFSASSPPPTRTMRRQSSLALSSRPPVLSCVFTSSSSAFPAGVHWSYVGSPPASRRSPGRTWRWRMWPPRWKRESTWRTTSASAVAMSVQGPCRRSIGVKCPSRLHWMCQLGSSGHRPSLQVRWACSHQLAACTPSASGNGPSQPDE
mmetsp:Transcript_6552/g.12802  ORF Transcript_6552/g.12802 Transcript_6552/m.12802 type:complete len:265 (+) Transcript_6552:362-1156(+)